MTLSQHTFSSTLTTRSSSGCSGSPSGAAGSCGCTSTTLTGDCGTCGCDRGDLGVTGCGNPAGALRHPWRSGRSSGIGKVGMRMWLSLDEICGVGGPGACSWLPSADALPSGGGILSTNSLQTTLKACQTFRALCQQLPICEAFAFQSPQTYRIGSDCWRGSLAEWHVCIPIVSSSTSVRVFESIGSLGPY